jgi:UDP-N-acetylglucosamine transferase subunit ALG13
MIFVTVGSQEPFDRLIGAVDEWARLRARGDVFAQIASSKLQPGHIEFTQFIEPSEFTRIMEEARLIVAHAGMGSIISALELGKPIVVMPRRADFRETRNDHQVATAERFGEQYRIIVALNEQDLPAKLDYALTLGDTDRIHAQASPRLIATIRAFLEGQPHPTEAAASTGGGADLARSSALTSLVLEPLNTSSKYANRSDGTAEEEDKLLLM